MASSLPAKLKVPAITPFVNRAAQLENFKPIVSYWCTHADSTHAYNRTDRNPR